MIRKYHSHTLQTNPRYCEEEPQKNNNRKTPGRQKSKATRSLITIKMIGKLERTQSHAHQNMEQTQNPTMGASNKNESTSTETLPWNGQQPKPLESLNTFYWYQIFALGSVVVKTLKLFSSHGGFLTIAMYQNRETI